MARVHPAVIVSLALVAVGFVVFVMKSNNNRNVYKMDDSSHGVDRVSEIIMKDTTAVESAQAYKLERNRLSAMLNDVKHELAIMSCEMLELQANQQKKVSRTGGWCKKTGTSTGGSHAFDAKLAEALTKFFKGKRVASFGDGPGDYKKYLDKSGLLTVYDAYDGAPYGPETSGGVLKFMDLTAPQYGLPVYDWVISLEVAEHIPAKYESIYVDNIVRHASTGIVLSWARLGQGGLSHVNNRPLEYVQKILSEKGFEPNLVESSQLQNNSTLPWLKKNIYVYRRRNNSFASPNLA